MEKVEAGPDLAARADMVMDTSAGAYVRSAMASGQFQYLREEFDFLGRVPGRRAQVAPVSAASRWGRTEPTVSRRDRLPKPESTNSPNLFSDSLIRDQSTPESADKIKC